MSKRLLFVVNVDWFFLSHRLPIALEAKRLGYEVHIATTITSKLGELSSYGFKLHFYSWKREGFSMKNEIKILLNLFVLFNHIEPNIIHLVTIKPVLYGGIAAHFCKNSPLVFAISGLGSIFSDRTVIGGLRRFFVGLIYRIALSHRNKKVIFQNLEDKDRLISVARLNNDSCEIIWGSGVDLCEFRPSHHLTSEFIVLMASRLILEKGVWIYIESAKQLKERGIKCRFLLAGDIDPGNPKSLSKLDLQKIREENIVELVGFSSDIPKLMAMVSIVVLPSFYGEGLPKVLIEAAASGKAIVTTDIPGCRDAIIAGHTGLLVEPGNSSSLANAIERLFHDQNLLHNMGKMAREYAENKFDIKLVVQKHMLIYQSLLKVKI